MGTLNEKLEYLRQTKEYIKEAIISKGQEVSSSDTFRSYASKISTIDTVNNEDPITVTPTTSSQTVTPDQNHTGLSSVTVSGVTSAIDANIQAGNIKKDVQILGVTGSYEGISINNQDKSVTVDGSYTADAGYTGLGTVTVTAGAIASAATQNEIAEELMLVNDGATTFTLTVSPTDATPVITSTTNSVVLTPSSSSGGVFVYSISANSSKTYSYSVSKEGYDTETGTINGGTSTKTVTLNEEGHANQGENIGGRDPEDPEDWED